MANIFGVNRTSNTLTLGTTDTDIVAPPLTASLLVGTDADKSLVSVSNLASWITGTANQITVTDDSDGTVTLSAPQDLHTAATPTFGGIIVANGGTIGQAAGPLLTFDDTNNYLEITGCNVGIGTSTPSQLYTIHNGNILLTRDVDDVYMTGFRSEKDRAGGTVADDDVIGVFRWSAHDGTQMSEAAEIELKVDGTPGDGDMPCRMLFKVSPAGSASAVVAMTILNSGYIGIGAVTPAAKLEVGGTTRLGDGGSNYVGIGATGNLSFTGSAGFYPRFLTQADEPAAGTGATQCDTSELVVWKNSGDSVVSICFNDSGTVKTVALA